MLKYAPDGAVVWDATFGDSITQKAASLAVDSADNVILFGRFIGSMDFGGAGTLDSSSGGAYDLFVAKLTSDGVPIWAQRFGSSDSENAFDVAVDASDSVLLTGSFQGTVDFGTGPMTAPNPDSEFLVKLSSGGTPTWAKQWNGYQSQYAVAADGDLNVVVTGWFSGTVDFGGPDLTGGSMYCLKLDANGDHLWSKSYGEAGSLSAAPYALAVDGDNHILVGGWAAGGIDLGTGPLPGVGEEIFVAKYAP